MKEWETKEALDLIETILMEEIPETAMSDEEVSKLAKRIVTKLEQEP